MGYTTNFTGKFSFDKPADAETVLSCRDLLQKDYRDADFPPGAPSAYLQWEITKDRLHLEWDGGEKFYDYVEWLQWLIDNKFKPAGLTLSGAVKYSGEETEDCGTLEIVDGQVIKTPATFTRVRVHCPNCDEEVTARLVTP